MLALCNTKFGIVNMVSSAVCRSLWKLRNLICFQGVAWVSLKSVWRLDPMLKCWKVRSAGLESVIRDLEAFSLELRDVAVMHAETISKRAAKSSRIPILREKRQLFISSTVIGSGSRKNVSLPNLAYFDVLSLLPLSIPSNGRPRLAHRQPPKARSPPARW
jgi:hypothetical protein